LESRFPANPRWFLRRLSFPWVLFVAAAAAIMGDNGGYWIGRKGGFLIIKRYGDVLHIDESKIERARTFFERHGAKTVFIGRFIALLRAWTALLAGVGQMRYGTFMLYNALGGVTWAVIFGELGYIFGRNLPRLEHYVGQATLAFVLLAVLVVALFLGGRWFRTNVSRLSTQIARDAGRLASSPTLQQLRAHRPQAWEFLVRRFEPGEYLGLHLTIGLVISIGALWLFGGVTEDVIHHNRPLCQGGLDPIAHPGPCLAGRCAMKTVREAVGDYLALRRSLGFKLKKHQRFLEEFASPSHSQRGSQLPVLLGDVNVAKPAARRTVPKSGRINQAAPA
jgi:membrane protein DedA with SNARE-associated domain